MTITRDEEIFGKEVQEKKNSHHQHQQNIYMNLLFSIVNNLSQNVYYINWGVSAWWDQGIDLCIDWSGEVQVLVETQAKARHQLVHVYLQLLHNLHLLSPVLDSRIAWQLVPHFGVAEEINK